MAENDKRKILFQLELDAAKSLPTIKAVREALKTTNAEFENTKQGTKEFDNLEVKTQALRAELKRLIDATKENSNALGGVNSSAKFVEGSFGALRQQIKGAKSDLDNTKIGTEEYLVAEAKLNSLLQQEIDIRKNQPSLFKERIKAAFDESGAIQNLGAALTEMKDKSQVANAIASAGVGDLKKAIKELKDEAAKQGGLNTLIGKELIDKAAQAQDKLTELNTSVKNLADGESTLLSIVQGAKGIAAGFTLAQGSAALFGGEQKELEAVLVKVQASMAVLNSLTEISHILQKDSTVALKATTAAQKVYTLVVGQSTGAMRILKLTLASLGIPLLVFALYELITNFRAVRQGVSDFLDKLGPLGAGIKVALLPLTLLIDGLEFLGQKLGLISSEVANQAEAAIASNVKVTESLTGRYDREIKLAQAAGKETTSLERQKLLAQNILTQKTIENFETIRKENGKLTEDQTKQLEDLKKTVQDNQTEITAITLKEQKKRADEQEKVEKAAADKAKKNAEDAAKNQSEAVKQIRDLEINNIDDPRARELARERATLEDKLAAIKVYGEKRRKLEALLREQSLKNQSNIELKYDQALAEKKISRAQATEISLENAALASAKNDEQRFFIRLNTVNTNAQRELEVLQLAREKELSDKELSEQARLEIIRLYNVQEMEVLANHAAEVRDLEFTNETAKQAAIVAAKQLALEGATPEEEFAKRQELLDAQYLQEIANAEQTGADKAAIDAKYAKMKEALDKATTDNTLNVTQGMLGNVSALLKKGSKEYKIIATAQATIDTYKAATAAYASAAAVPVIGYVLGPLAAALAVAAGIANIAQINKTKEFAKGGLTSFEHGGPIAAPQFGLIGEKGPEWVAPNWMLSHPTTAPLIAGLESVRSSPGPILPFADGGFTAAYYTAPVDTATNLGNNFIEAVKRIRPVVEVQQIISGIDQYNEVTADAIA